LSFDQLGAELVRHPRLGPIQSTYRLDPTRLPLADLSKVNSAERLESLKVQMLATPDQQISLTDPDSRSMATSGRGSGVVGYNVQVAVDTAHHLIITHEVTNVGITGTLQLGPITETAEAVNRYTQ
jgi:hypothetical protein